MEKKLLISIIVLMLGFLNGYSLTKSVTSGNWTNSATWSNGVPTCTTDSIIIQAGHTVTVNVQQDYSSCPAPIHMVIYGTLTFQTGKKLMFPVGSTIYIAPGGSIQPAGGGGSADLIEIGGIVEWRSAEGPLTGPAWLPEGAYQPMPIELLSFTAQPSGSKVDLKWSTVTETNNDYFTIEKTQDGNIFQTVTNIDGAGNSILILNYSAFDLNPFNGISYYRLKQTDFDGKHSYSDLIAVNYSASEKQEFNIYINPDNNNELNIIAKDLSNRNVSVAMHDVSGKLCYSRTEIVDETGSVILNSLNKLSTGIYIVTAITQQDVYSRKIFIK